jgi:hypothetical protein
VREELANARDGLEPRLERTAFAAVPIMEATDELATRAWPVGVDRAASSLTCAFANQSRARLLEALAAVEDAEASTSRGLHFPWLEADAAEERPVTAQPTGLAERREVFLD